MSNLRTIERALAVRNYGSNCYCCGKGPLSGKSLFLEPIGWGDVGGPGAVRPNAPVCGACRTTLKTTAIFHHIENLRKDARKALVTTRRWSNTYGLNTPLFIEQARYDLVPETK